jgi:predicted kinase
VRKRQPPHPLLILIVGVAGSGKTTLARGVARRVSAVYLDNNYIADAFFPDTRNGRAYTKLRPRFYRALYTIAEENLKLGNSVLLDVPHVKEMQNAEWRRFIRHTVARTNAELKILRCLCSEEVLRSRLESRGEPRDRWKLKNWNRFLTQEPIRVEIPFPHIEIDTEHDLSRNIATAVRYIVAGKAERSAHSAKGEAQSAKEKG